MKRAIVNFSNGCDYESFKNYASENKISLSRAILELAQRSLDTWEDERVARIAVERQKDSGKYLSTDEFLEKISV